MDENSSESRKYYNFSDRIILLIKRLFIVVGNWTFTKRHRTEHYKCDYAGGGKEIAQIKHAHMPTPKTQETNANPIETLVPTEISQPEDVLTEIQTRNMEPEPIVDPLNPKVIPSKFYFPLNKGDLFLKMYTECTFQCVYEAIEASPGIFHYTIISADKAKAWDISDAVTNVGSILQHNASNHKNVSFGTAVRKEDNETVYWVIEEKAKIVYQK